MNNYSRGELLEILKRVAVIFGIAVALISIYFSYDGLDQTVGELATNTTDAAKYIGAFVAIVITLLQFIFNTDFKNLNLTLKVLGAASYAYSIYTNFAGIQHVFAFDTFVCWFFAGIMDVLPEALIAWGLDEHLQGDFLGNVTKMILGDRKGKGGGGGHQKQQKHFAAETPMDTQPRMRPSHPIQQNPQHQAKKGKGRSFLEQQRHEQGKHNRFAGFGEDEE